MFRLEDEVGKKKIQITPDIPTKKVRKISALISCYLIISLHVENKKLTNLDLTICTCSARQLRNL